MEAEGLSVPVVDAMVTRGLEAVLREAEKDGDLLPV